ncbi:rhomboid domain-containing protein 2 [Chanos chanos]|uniref:Rhomboid domain-containing protein 2 n=1 Tax=Chanos chanos TaxID=29144 RepID=A0A6J2WV67_CHACN|nr:rhomboid domain-containing protein 2 [Chanos chanos]
MKNTVQSMFRKFVNSVTGLEFTSGVAIVVAVSCLLYIITSYFNTSEYTFSLGSSVFLNGHVHKLFFYSFYNKDAMQLILSAGVLVSFTSGLEKGVGTVRFLYLLLLLSVWTGLLHVLLEILLFPHDSRSSVSGLIPTSLSMLGMITIRSPMTKAFLMGISVPTASFPWFILLIITLFIPNTVLLCNVLAIVTGEIYGMGWLSVFEMSESSASVLEKKMPFRLLRRMVGVKFVPSSAEERRKVFYTKCNPPPGSYPVQAYAPAPPQAVGDQPNTFDGWPQSSYMQEQHVFPSPFPAHGHGHSHGHGLQLSFLSQQFLSALKCLSQTQNLSPLWLRMDRLFQRFIKA